MRALIATALLAQACAGSYVYRRTFAPPGDLAPRPSCNVEIIYGAPTSVAGTGENNDRRRYWFQDPYGRTRAYEQVGIIEYRGRRGSDWPTRDRTRLRDLLTPTVCRDWGSAIAVQLDADGYFVGGIVLEEIDESGGPPI